jgi:hypothetical protein
MASITRQVSVSVPPGFAWEAVKDVGALHSRLARGVVVDTKLEPGARLVTFNNGTTVKELIIGIDDERMRLAYAIIGIPVAHYSASLQVASGAGTACVIVSTTDLLPDEAASRVAPMVEQSLQAMKRTLEEDFALHQSDA